MTTANKITIVRILLVPFFVVQAAYYEESGAELHRILALLSFGMAALSDGIDGYIARRFNQRSELGAILDPLADKLLLISGIVLLSLTNQYLPKLPLWLVVTVISRDVIIVLGSLVIHLIGGKVRVHPRLAGKVATVLQMITVLWALLRLDAGWLYGWCLAAAVLTAVSGCFYIYDGMRQMNANPSSLPTGKS